MLKMILFEKQAVPFKSLRTKVLLKIIFIKICKENRATFGKLRLLTKESLYSDSSCYRSGLKAACAFFVTLYPAAFFAAKTYVKRPKKAP